jgi:hypothetical protein
LRKQSYERHGDRLVLILDKNETDLETDEQDVKQTVTTTVEISKSTMKLTPNKLRFWETD